MSAYRSSPGFKSQQEHNTAETDSPQELRNLKKPIRSVRIPRSAAADCDCELCWPGSNKSIREHNQSVLFRECDSCHDAVPERYGRFRGILFLCVGCCQIVGRAASIRRTG